MRAYLVRKFFATPAGYKPPPEPKTNDEKDGLHMGSSRLLAMIDPDDAGIVERSESEQLKKSPHKGTKPVERKGSPSGPTKKRRKIADDSDEEDVKSAAIPANPAPKSDTDGKPTSPTKEQLKKALKETAAESPPSDEESDPPAGEDEPELDIQSEKKVAEKLLDTAKSMLTKGQLGTFQNFLGSRYSNSLLCTLCYLRYDLINH